MRKFKTLSLLFFAVSVIGASCTKEGPEGPVGASGAQGPAGVAGAPGAGQTSYSAWVAATAADWVLGYVAPNNYNAELAYNRTAPGITQAILDQGVILAYGKNFIIGASTVLASVEQLPWTESFNGQYYGFVNNLGKITFIYDLIAGASARPTSQLTISYRYILIPGSATTGKGPKLYNGHTEEELRSLPYEQVLAEFHIPEDGSNIR